MTVLPAQATARGLFRPHLGRAWLASFSGQVVQVGLQAASFVLLARFLGVETFGVRIGLSAVAAMAGPLVGFGFANLLIRNVAQNPDTFAESWGNALLVTALTGAALIAVVVPCTIALLPGSPGATVVAAVLFSDLASTRVASLSASAYQARGRFAEMARTGALLQALRFSAVALCLVVNPGSSRLAWWAAISAVASSAGVAIVLRTALRRLGEPVVSVARIRAEWRAGLHFVLSPYTQVVNNEVDKLILGRVATLAALGAYGAAYRLLSAALVPLLSLLTVTYPLFFEHGATGIRASRRFARAVATYAIPAGVMASVAILVGSRALVAALGPGFDDTAAILRWLCVLPVLKAVQLLFADALTGAGFQRRRTAIQGGAALLNVLLNVVLDPTLGWFGATIATLVSDTSLAAALGVGALWTRDGVGSAAGRTRATATPPSPIDHTAASA